MRILIDTSAFYALADEDDQYHSQAKAYYQSIIGQKELVTTDYILVECWFLIKSRLGKDQALAFWDGLRSGFVTLIMVEREDLERGRKIMEDFADQDFSLVDVTTFAVMVRLGIKEAFTFDKHFSVYRYGERRDQYFIRWP